MQSDDFDSEDELLRCKKQHMRTIEKKEFKDRCSLCDSILETSEDIKFKLEMKNIVCPVCKEYNIIK